MTGTPDIIKLSGATSSFKVSKQPGQTLLKKGEKTAFTLRFKPTNTSQLSVIVILPNSSENAPDFNFTVYGQGKRESPEIKVFTGEQEIAANGTYDFGPVGTTKQKDLAFAVKNTGRAVLTLGGDPLIQIIDDAEGFFTVTQQAGSTPIAPNSAGEPFIVRFSPTAAGTKTAKVKIISDSGGSANHECIFTVTGQGERETPEIKVFNNADQEIGADGSYNFGLIRTSEQKAAAFTIKNTGKAVLTLGGTPLVQIMADAEGSFTVTQEPSSASIAPNTAGETFVVRFSPTATGTKTAKLRIISDSSGSTNHERIFTVTGTAILISVTAAADSTSSITVNWSSVAEATGYSIYRATSSSGSYTKAGTSSSASYTDTGLAAGTTYYYKVTADNVFVAEGEQSNVASATTNSPPAPSLGALLTNGVWTRNTIGSEVLQYYYIYAQAGATYTVFWEDGSDYGGLYYSGGNVSVSAYWYSDNSVIFSARDKGYTTGSPFTASKTGYVMLKAENGGRSGKYAIEYTQN